MSDLRTLVAGAIADLCTRFERGGYNPTPIVDLGVLVARADGKVDEHEREALREVFEALLDERLNSEVVGHLIAASLEVIELAGVDARARLIAEILKDCDAVEQGLLVALGIAFASEGLSNDERAVITKIADVAGMSHERLDALAEKVRAKVEEAGGPDSARSSLHIPISRRTL